ncbi:MAG: hypothetical protein KIS97_13475 [Nitrospira sp.]|nr:hypothetical protein [Nitrospira sp.]
MSDTKKTIPVLTDTSVQDDVKDAFGHVSSPKVIELPSDVIANNLQNFIGVFESTIDPAVKNDGNFQIDEVELNLSISAEGGFSLIGQMSGGVETSVKVKLKRRVKA